MEGTVRWAGVVAEAGALLEGLVLLGSTAIALPLLRRRRRHDSVHQNNAIAAPGTGNKGS
jgi:hypothetical protein